MRRWAYPVFLDLHGRKVVVVGGGKVAEAKTLELLEAGARITVIAERLEPSLECLVREHSIEHLPRAFERGDFEGASLALAERSERSTYELLAADAERCGVFLNIQDEIEFCSFSAPARVERGALTLAIATDGNAPALAVRIKERLAGWFGAEYGRFLDLAGRLRAPLARNEPKFSERRRIWYELVDSNVLRSLREGDEAAVIETVSRITGLAPSEWLELDTPNVLPAVADRLQEAPHV